MIKIQVATEGPPVGPQVAANLEKIKVRVQGALTRASTKLGESIVTKGRADISGAGKFGPRWTQGLTFNVVGTDNTRTVSIRESAAHWQTHQYGAIIHGKPLLYFKPGIPILNRKGQATNPAVISVPSVRIPKRFHLVEIVQAESKTFGALYRVEMASGG